MDSPYSTGLLCTYTLDQLTDTGPGPVPPIRSGSMAWPRPVPAAAPPGYPPAGVMRTMPAPVDAGGIHPPSA